MDVSTLSKLGIVNSKQLDVIVHILKHVCPDSGEYIGSYRRIAQRTNTSLDTIRRTMKKLQALGLIIQVQWGVYQVSPEILPKARSPLVSYLIETPEPQVTRQPIIQVGDNDWVAVSQL